MVIVKSLAFPCAIILSVDDLVNVSIEPELGSCTFEYRPQFIFVGFLSW